MASLFQFWRIWNVNSTDKFRFNSTKIGQSTGGPLLTLFFETLEKQQCKQKTVQAEEWFSTKWKNKSTKINRVTYLENHVVREPCKQRTVCTYHHQNEYLIWKDLNFMNQLCQGDLTLTWITTQKNFWRILSRKTCFKVCNSKISTVKESDNFVQKLQFIFFILVGDSSMEIWLLF